MYDVYACEIYKIEPNISEMFVCKWYESVKWKMLQQHMTFIVNILNEKYSPDYCVVLHIANGNHK